MTKNTYRVTLPITFTFSEPDVEQIFGNYKKEKPVKEKPVKEKFTRKKTTLAEMEKSCLVEAVEEANGNQTRAAKILGIDVRTLKSKLNKYRILTTSEKPTRRRRKKRPSKHTLESCVAAAQKFKSRSDWQRDDRNSYSAARRNKWLDICCKHMTPKVRGRPAQKQKQIPANFQGFKFDGAVRQ